MSAPGKERTESRTTKLATSQNLNYDLTDTCINETIAARSITPYCLKIMPFSVFCVQINNVQEA